MIEITETAQENSTNVSAWHISQPSFLPLQLLQWPLAPLMPANIPSDSVSAGNKCPSFTVGWLIYTNYRSLCSREDDRIIWDESIKSLLSQAVSHCRIRSGVERAWWEAQTWAPCMRTFFGIYEHTSHISHKHTHTEIRAVSSQTKSLLLHKLSSRRHHYPNHSILTKNADSRVGPIQAKTHTHTHTHTLK